MNKRKTSIERRARKRRSTLFLIAIILGIVTTAFITIPTASNGAKQVTALECNSTKIANIAKIDTIHIVDSLFNLKRACMDTLIYEVTKYIITVQPKAKVTSIAIINNCFKDDVDIPLCMSQAQLESSFGFRTGGTNSVFGIYNVKYKTCDASVPKYTSLIKTKYLVTRSVDRLLATGFHVEGSAKYKYAEDPSYCSKIKRIRDHILSTTHIDKLQARIKDIDKELSNWKL